MSYRLFLLACLEKSTYILSKKTLLISTGITVHVLDKTTRVVIHPYTHLTKMCTKDIRTSV
ncbi:hypothetical protein [Buchnera aphidicola]|uniref:hypothetical protein n=1 Tax=Buchnera aphidicola TaxID=9 RepID=UPI0012AC2F77|nr:hypothetical protein [Buchnera aphidicola]